MKNISHSPVTEMLSGRHKIWLMIGLALLPIADLSACIALWVFGAASEYWWLPFAMTVADVLYLLGVALSNQRFKYAQKLFFVYIVTTIVFLIIWLVEFANDSLVILTDTAQAACGLLHVVGIAAVAISYLYASRRLRVGRHIQLALAIAFSSVALLTFVVIYGVTVIGEGYFGQGHGNLPLVYSYVGEDECEVTDIVNGKGDRVVIPDEFNGRKVTKVSAKVFSYANVKSVTLNCGSNIELCGDISSSININTDIIIYVDKQDVDTIKKMLYSRDSRYYYRYQHELGNNVRPIGLSRDEVYVTFDYNRDSYYVAESVIIPTWYGKKGDTFRLTDIDGVDYAEHSDVSSDDDLYYCFQNVGYNGGGNIMSELKDGGKALDGMVIDKSRNNIPVRFQKVYKVYAGESNDSMYDTDTQFIFSTVNGVKCDYKLTVAENADELLRPFDRGEAFTRTMRYMKKGSEIYQEFTSLSSVLQEGNNAITIAPYWELVKPQITLSQITADADIIYGDDFELTASVTYPLSGVQIEYEWYDDTQRIGYAQLLQTSASTAGMRAYTAIVKVSAPEVTSCTSADAAVIKVNVNKRPLTVTWEHKSLAIMGDEAQTYSAESVYDGKQRTIQPRAQNLAYDDYILFTGYTAIDAGTDTVSATLSSSLAKKYYIAEGETYTYTIKPRPVALTWDEQAEFEYDGYPHNPTASAKDLSGGDLVIYYIGKQTDAGENYTATAQIVNINYTIDDTSEKSMGFTITPKRVDVVWGNNELIYNKKLQVPAASATGVNGSGVKLSVIGGQINANLIGGSKATTYTAIATSEDGNYTLNPDTVRQEFTISPYTVDEITWTNTTVTYNGSEQAPVASATDADGKPMTIYVGGETEEGEYTKQVRLSDNYVIASGATIAFTIKPMEVSVEWGNISLTYNGGAQVPTATAKGVNGEDLPLTVTATMMKNDKIGPGTATAALATENHNYKLTGTSRVFVIGSKKLTVVIQDVTIEYGQTADVDFTIDGILDGDDVTAIPTAEYTLDENGNIPVGEYDVIIQLDGEDKNCYEVKYDRQGKVTVTAPTQTAED